MSSPHTTLHTHADKSIYSFSYLVPHTPHTETLRPETKAQVKVDKRCLWIFCVTHGNHCLHSPCNYLLTDLILAVKWLAKSMCTQTGPESKVVHAIYLPSPSHTWYTAISKPGQEASQSDLTRAELNACWHTHKYTKTNKINACLIGRYQK